MRLDEYTVFPYQAGDVIFAMRNGQPAVLIDPTTLPGGGGGGGNFADTNLTYDADRLHDLAGFSMTLSGGSLYRMTAGVAPPLSSASFDFIGYGSTGSDLTHVFGSGAGDSVEIYGDLSARFYGNVGFGTAPTGTSQVSIDGGAAPFGASVNGSSVGLLGTGDTGLRGIGTTFGVVGNGLYGFYGEGSIASVYGNSSGGAIGVLGTSIDNLGGSFSSTNESGVQGVSVIRYGGDFKGVIGVLAVGDDYGVEGYGEQAGGYFYSDGAGWGVIAHENTGSAGAMNCQGKALFNGTAATGSALVQVDSTTQGFLPPRMTEAQRLAISSPAIGLLVYQTDGTEGVYVNKSGGWVLI